MKTKKKTKIKALNIYDNIKYIIYLRRGVFMKDKIETNIRKWISLIIAVLIYYVIHEGSHLLVALSYGVFKKIKLSTLGVQIVINDANLSNFNLAIFCVVGFLSTFITSYILVLLINKIVKLKSKYLKTIFYYTTLILLLLDPLYLTILYNFVGGGDMNGILLFNISNTIIKLFFFIILILNLFVFIKVVLPKYKKSFN